jgi:DNA-binding MarR family transcriptional regulator
MVEQSAEKEVKRENAKAQGPVTAEDFARLVAGMNRFLGQLASCAAFQEAAVGLGEWLVLNHLSKEPVEQRRLNRDLGVTKQRVAQICESLKKSGYIAITPVTNDPRMNSVAITDAGKAEVTEVNARLMPVLANDNDNGKKQQALHSASRSFRILKRIFDDPAEKAKKADRLTPGAKV